jgi:molybdate transport system substrate-binding protein
VRTIFQVPALGLLAILLNCSRPGPSGRAEILAAAAANLTDSFAELARVFTAKTGIRVIFSFGATGDLATQIENGAPYDVFAAADVQHVDALKSKGLLIPETCARYARGRLVLWTPQGGPIHQIQDVTRVQRVAIANPDIAPYGEAAVESLRALGIWEQVQPKVVYANNVSQTKQYASTGNVDAAFLPLSLVIGAGGHYLEVDERLHRPIDQALGVVKASKKQDLAQRFAAFVLSPEGQAILKQYGYAPV